MFFLEGHIMQMIMCPANCSDPPKGPGDIIEFGLIRFNPYVHPFVMAHIAGVKPR